MSTPVQERPGYSEHTNAAISRELGELCARHCLTGAVLITFDVPAEKIGSTSSGASDLMMLAMDDLGLRILGLIDDGTLRPFKPPGQPSPRGH